MYLTTYDPFARLTRHAFGQATVMPLDGVRRDGDVLLRFDVLPPRDPRVSKARSTLSSLLF